MKQDLCIKIKNDFFSTTYYNICDGTEKLVSKGTMEIMANVPLLAFFVAITAMIGVIIAVMLAMIVHTIKD